MYGAPTVCLLGAEFNHLNNGQGSIILLPQMGKQALRSHSHLQRPRDSDRGLAGPTVSPVFTIWHRISGRPHVTPGWVLKSSVQVKQECLLLS